ncbi:LytTR family DNA-binding domain-containing protein [Lactobacillus sp. Sy-1]|uniref:LytTR family DNA-binding domain-containing protein n=1 Tax=Lactobacillus sp. Sy-1 TaxID=2109645 RepID=UPI001C55F05B|nr:LytTR family DNA-binding domain-containing protein [Lactobacillus sp. Sy-1]MBW1605007.1 LytTR family transcriptional regulator [Lactobacillus sp. Sy-1]
MEIKINISKQFKIPFISINSAEQTSEINSVYENIQIINNSWQLRGALSDKLKTIYLYQIISFHTEGSKVVCETWHDTYQVQFRIYELANKLPANLFIQISSSEIVAISCINNLELTKSGSYKVYLKNKRITYTSRRYVKKIREHLLNNEIN